ncbi:MAG: HypC/HybG/HupF family hydrogenase formation chaperone [Candidatus Hydrogenedentota bacterium]
MCLSVIGKVEEIKNNIATVEVFGARTQCLLDLLAESVTIGDYVLLHAGFAINKLDKDEAIKTINDIKKIMSIEDDRNS